MLTGVRTPFDLAFADGYGEPTSPRAGKISTAPKSPAYSPSIHVVGGESSVFSGVDVRGASVDP